VFCRCLFPNSIRTILSRTCLELFQAISTCRDCLKPRNFPATSSFRGPRPRLSCESATSGKLAQHIPARMSRGKSAQWNLGFVQQLTVIQRQSICAELSSELILQAAQLITYVLYTVDAVSNISASFSLF